MANELDLYESGGGLEVYRPDQPLAPTADDTWGSEPDYLSEHTPQVQQGNFTPEQHQNISQLAGIFTADFSYLNHPPQLIQEVITLFKHCVLQPPSGARKNHSYNLYQYSSDPVMAVIANRLHQLGASQKFVTDLCWWAAELEKKLGIKVAEQSPVVSDDPMDYLSDTEWEQVVKNNDIARAQTEAALRARFGRSYDQEIAALNDFISKLSAAERKHLDQYTAPHGVHALSNLQVITTLYSQMVGQLPSGPALAVELAALEDVIRKDRRRWNNSPQLQARYRTLLDLRGY